MRARSATRRRARAAQWSESEERGIAARARARTRAKGAAPRSSRGWSVAARGGGAPARRGAAAAGAAARGSAVRVGRGGHEGAPEAASDTIAPLEAAATTREACALLPVRERERGDAGAAHDPPVLMQLLPQLPCCAAGARTAPGGAGAIMRTDASEARTQPHARGRSRGVTARRPRCARCWTRGRWPSRRPIRSWTAATLADRERGGQGRLSAREWPPRNVPARPDASAAAARDPWTTRASP